MDSSKPQAVSEGRRMFAAAAWLMLGWLIAGYVTTVPAVDSWISSFEGTSLGKLLIGAMLVAMGASALVLWIAALRFAALHTRKGSASRLGLFAVLILGNVVAAFFYYFLNVLWQRDGGAPAPIGGAG